MTPSREMTTNPEIAAVTGLLPALGFIALGVSLGAGGIHVGDTDDAPGAALLGVILVIGLVAFGIRSARRRRKAGVRD